MQGGKACDTLVLITGEPSFGNNHNKKEINHMVNPIYITSTVLYMNCTTILHIGRYYTQCGGRS